MTEHDALDRAIDEAARTLTSGVPTHTLRARVVERIERPRRDRGRVWQVAAAVAVLAIIGYAVWPAREPTRRPVVATAPAAAPASPRAQRVPLAQSPSRSEVAVPPARRDALRRAVRTRVLPRIPIDPDASQIAALVDVNELTVSVAQPRDLDVPGLNVRDVTIAPLEPDEKERR